MSDFSSSKELLSRPRCVLIGCLEADTYPGCVRCSAHIYEDFVQYGKLEPLFRFYWRVRHALRLLKPIKRCDQCGKKYVKGYDEYLCSEKCHDNWLPF